jgi:hypothetical protein
MKRVRIFNPLHMSWATRTRIEVMKTEAITYQTLADSIKPLYAFCSKWNRVSRSRFAVNGIALMVVPYPDASIPFSMASEQE